ncbi:xylulokinase [Phytomonospora endophytica]|uniref:Xylulose kinase n=1 Tax=Phytomonospora endophytica TaxID=714109 RepID=A0A841FI76_9ACTN|nr:xylulokinase [Phytomonospora endophytica]MBB6032359.1 xylulokinase [Phytomonospora endophytica]
MTLVAGVDCGTQSTKVVVCDAASGRVVRSGSAPHPDATEVDPEIWWKAFAEASAGLLDGVEAMAVGGQQHGMVCLDAADRVLRPAILWNDTRSAPDAVELIGELGGAGRWAEATGSVPVASFTVTKLRWLARNEPEHAARTNTVLLPHDWLTWRLTGSFTTDRGDASGTGYWSPSTQDWRPDLLGLALGREPGLPRVAAPAEIVGRTGDGIRVAAGTGDNAAAALGLGLHPGDAVVSIGTSGTVYAVAESPTADATGTVAGFADATGRHLPLVATLNAARVLGATTNLLGRPVAELTALALAARPGAGGLAFLPYLDGERTPNLPDATGTLTGLTRANMTPENLARAAVEGMLCALADGLDALRGLGVPVNRVRLIGGAAASAAVRHVAGTVFDVPVTVPAPAEYVALGAARQAAWALSGAAEAPDWPVEATGVEATTVPAVREGYRAAQESVLGWTRGLSPLSTGE